MDAGVSSITATGQVYNLANLQDVAGNYTVAAAGIALGGGAGASYLKNEHGVVIKVIASTKGLRFNLSANGISVKLKT